MDYALHVLRLRTKFGERAFSHADPATWNAQPVRDNVRIVADPVKFRKLLKSHYFRIVFSVCWTVSTVIDCLDRPFCERSILCFCACFFFPLFPNSLFPTSASRYFRNFSTWRGFTGKKKCCYADFLKVPPNKNEGEKPQFRPISRLIATYYAPSLVLLVFLVCICI